MNNPFAYAVFQALQNNDPTILYRMMGGYQNFQNALNQFSQQFGNRDPQQAVQELLNSREMSQQQFNQISKLADMIRKRRG